MLKAGQRLRSYTKAFKWYEKAANLGYSKGQVNLGSMYYSGRGLKSGPSYEMAAKLFQEAADQGDPIAQNNLGICYEIGRGVEKNKLEAMQLYERSAKSGNPSGMNNWGYMRTSSRVCEWWRRRSAICSSSGTIPSCNCRRCFG